MKSLTHSHIARAAYEAFIRAMQRDEWLHNEIAIEKMQEVDKINEWKRYRYEREDYVFDEKRY